MYILLWRSILNVQHVLEVLKIYFLLVSLHRLSQLSASTKSRWLKCVLHNSRIDITKFQSTSHSIRSASVSGAKQIGISVQEIMYFAGWKSEQTFARFYDKHVSSEDTYSKAILRHSV